MKPLFARNINNRGRVVSLSVPLVCESARASSTSHCAGVQMPPGTRMRAMKINAFSWPSLRR